jgi:hypothetical protein
MSLQGSQKPYHESIVNAVAQIPPGAEHALTRWETLAHLAYHTKAPHDKEKIATTFEKKFAEIVGAGAHPSADQSALLGKLRSGVYRGDAGKQEQKTGIIPTAQPMGNGAEQVPAG